MPTFGGSTLGAQDGKDECPRAPERAQDRPKKAQEGSKRGPVEVQEGPRRPQESPRRASKRAQEGSKKASELKTLPHQCVAPLIATKHCNFTVFLAGQEGLCPPLAGVLWVPEGPLEGDKRGR